jgi:hypothetical protein
MELSGNGWCALLKLVAFPADNFLLILDRDILYKYGFLM